VSISSLPIPPGKLAISVLLGDPQRVAGFVKPGSSVAIFLTLPNASGDRVTRTVLPKSLVIAVGPTTALAAPSGEGNTEDVPSAILTLGLTQRDAQKVILAQDLGDLYLGLLTARSRVTGRPVATAANLFA
jgi:pilus assembly protein CpaB